jgi:hypothetical protein
VGRLLGLFTGLLFLTGCQLGVLQGPETGMEPAEFARIWELYQDCRRSDDVAAVLAKAPHWERMATIQSRRAGRLSVDPRALAAACAVHTGHVALAQGETGLAVELFSLVIQRYPEPDYAYYVAQARDGLSQTAPEMAPVSAHPARKDRAGSTTHS